MIIVSRLKFLPDIEGGLIAGLKFEAESELAITIDIGGGIGAASDPVFRFSLIQQSGAHVENA